MYIVKNTENRRNQSVEPVLSRATAAIGGGHVSQALLSKYKRTPHALSLLVLCV